MSEENVIAQAGPNGGGSHRALVELIDDNLCETHGRPNCRCWEGHAARWPGCERP